MAPNSRIVLIRHAEAFHNITCDWTIPDPPLSQKGERQVSELLEDTFSNEYPNHKDIELLVVSPTQRTLHTAILAFGKEIASKQFGVVVSPLFQETQPSPCDVPSPLEDLRKLYPQFDYTPLENVDYRNKISGIFATQNLKERAEAARKFLNERKERNIVVVTHSGFLRWLTPHDFPKSEEQDHYMNCEWREVVFGGEGTDSEIGGPYKLVETDLSIELRKKRKAAVENAAAS